MGNGRRRRGGGFRRIRRYRFGVLVGLAIAVLVAAYGVVLEYSAPHVSGDGLELSSFVTAAEDGHIQRATILDADGYVVGDYRHADGTVGHFNTPYFKDTRERLVDVLINARVPFGIDQQTSKRMVALGSFLLPSLILILLFAYLIISYRRGTGLFGIRSGAVRASRDGKQTTFADVAGQDAAIVELREIAQFLADPARFASLGATMPKGVLLFGPPGCGKTLLARALAGEAGASFFSISGSDFVELYAGVGAARVRDLFKRARESAPALIFIDELDSIGRARVRSGAVMPNGEQEQALNQVLAELDGFSPSQGIIVLAATNRPDVLDPALLRPGRFDRTVGLAQPDAAGRLAILTLHAQGRQLDGEADLGAVAERSIGLTGADLASVMNEGALLAARAGHPAITQADLDQALRRILEAPERQRRLSLRDRSVGRRSTSEQRATFADVAGADDAVVELAEVREYLADPERFARMGARVPRGILLAGPPGCGKTLLARALAGEANAGFLSVAASEFVEVFAGQGASRVRDLFAEARSVAPAIVFIDELDAIGARRSGAGSSGHGEREQTLNQILIELDGFEARSGVIVMAATNRADMLDPALIRPGRFDRRIAVQPPDREGRRAILQLHARDKVLAGDVDLDMVAAITPGLTGADLANVLNEAALLAARARLDRIPMELLERGVERTAMGASSRGRLLSEPHRRLVAYHEAGHALVQRALAGPSSVHRLSIMAHADNLGHTWVVRDDQGGEEFGSWLRDHLAVLLGGRAAEELVFADRAAGAADDLARAGRLARRMVTELGMSDALGPLTYPSDADPMGRPRACSDEVAAAIDAEVRRLVDEAHARAAAVLSAARPALDRVATALLERETLGSDDLRMLIEEGGEAKIGSFPPVQAAPKGPMLVSTVGKAMNGETQ